MSLMKLFGWTLGHALPVAGRMDYRNFFKQREKGVALRPLSVDNHSSNGYMLARMLILVWKNVVALMEGTIGCHAAAVDIQIHTNGA